jgi:hypothetical protein
MIRAEDGRHLTTDTGINTSLDANQYSTQHMTAHGKANGASETEAGLARYPQSTPKQNQLKSVSSKRGEESEEEGEGR